MRRVFLATPTYSGTLTVEYVGALLANAADLTGRGIVPDIHFRPGLCYIGLARNEIVTAFMETGIEDLVFLDDDVGFPADGVWKLLEHDRDVVAGVYPLKREGELYPVKLKEGATRDNAGMIECDGLPTGFMRIKREVLARMIEAMPERAFVDRLTKATHYNLFSCEQVGDTWWGEDYRFCQLAREVGARLWCIPDMDFRHVGRNVWSGNLQTKLEAA
jgi:hypothetical protein